MRECGEFSFVSNIYTLLEKEHTYLLKENLIPRHPGALKYMDIKKVTSSLRLKEITMKQFTWRPNHLPCNLETKERGSGFLDFTYRHWLDFLTFIILREDTWIKSLPTTCKLSVSGIKRKCLSTTSRISEMKWKCFHTTTSWSGWGQRSWLPATSTQTPKCSHQNPPMMWRQWWAKNQRKSKLKKSALSTNLALSVWRRNASLGNTSPGIIDALERGPSQYSPIVQLSLLPLNSFAIYNQDLVH